MRMGKKHRYMRVRHTQITNFCDLTRIQSDLEHMGRNYMYQMKQLLKKHQRILDGRHLYSLDEKGEVQVTSCVDGSRLELDRWGREDDSKS